jgi:glycerophosphoryl diester phosphodiesterase
MRLNQSFLKKNRYILALLIAVLLGVPVICYVSVLYQFNSIKTEAFRNIPKHMIWAHRGFTRGYPDNSIESFDAAQKMGYYGIELDIYYIKGRGFLVTHDAPLQGAGSNPGLFLNTVFNRYQNAFYYWLDFKNLDTKNAEESGKLLSGYIHAYGLQNRVFVESKHARALSRLKSAAPINTIYWLHGNLRKRSSLFKSKFYTVLAGADAVSLPVKYADEHFINNFSHLNMAVFTVNDAATIERLFANGVRIILTDVDMRSKFPDAYRISRR